MNNLQQPEKLLTTLKHVKNMHVNLTLYEGLIQNRLLGFVALPYQNNRIYFRFLSYSTIIHIVLSDSFGVIVSVRANTVQKYCDGCCDTVCSLKCS